MSEKRELPAELKAIEAELAALVPRTDEFDRERLVFLAGQASVQKAGVLGGRHASQVAWPMATAAMTAIAASLLAVVMTKSGPETETRVVYREIERSQPGEDGDVDRVEPDPSPPQALPEAPGRWDDPMPSRALAWIDYPDRERVRLETGYFRQLDRMLDRRAALPDGVLHESTVRRSSSDTKRAAAPVTYQELLDSVIEIPRPKAGPPDTSAGEVPSYRGVNS